MIDLARLEAIFTRVSKPGKYLGNEINVIKKDFDKAEVKVALIFPDDYEIGMSHVGLKILYDILNQLPHVVAERVFAPAVDMEAELRKEGISLFSLESRRPLKDFDILGFSLTYELTYTNLLNILDLAGIPLWQKDRDASHPLVLAGGGSMMNAEPMAEFLDAAALGDGEELILDIVETVRNHPKNATRGDLLNALSAIEGIYIPSFFEPAYNADGTLQAVKPLKPGYEKVKRRTVQNLDKAAYPTSLLVPSVRIIHDRVGIEIQRGCNRACRFCQAGYIDRPVRQRSPETVLKIAEESLQKTGIEDVSLLSLSAADYACLVPLLKELNGRYAEQKISISVPATRTEKLTPELIEQIKKVRKTGFTIAPEAGSERMRRVINKGNKVDDLFRAVTSAFSAGWDLLKLYYMVGLPFERDEDVLGIADEGNQSMQICKKYSSRAELHLSLSSFVPKPHTPFQWDPQMTIDETRRKYGLVRQSLKDKRIRLKHHHPEMSYIEGILSRGDRRVAQLLYLAFQEGCRFDEWQEHFDFSKWQRAIEKSGLSVDFYLHRQRDKEEIFPWEHLFAQMDKQFLWEEREKAHDAAFTEDCSVSKCTDCGVCDFRAIKNRIFVPGDQEVMVKKGNREWYGWNPANTPRPSAPKIPIVYNTDNQTRQSVQKLRARFAKTGNGRFMGHLELMGVLKRAFKRLQLPVAFSQGFHPQMKLAMGYPLPVGVESEWEFFELELLAAVETEGLAAKLNAILPEGLKVLKIEAVDKGKTSLYSSTTEVEYAASWIPGDAWSNDTVDAVNRFNAAREFLWFREGDKGSKKFDLKELVDLDCSALPQTVSFKTKIDPLGSLKPSEVLRAVFGIEKEALSRVRLKKISVRWKDCETDQSSTNSEVPAGQ